MVKLLKKRPSVKKLTTKFSSRNGRSKASSSASSVVSSNTQASSASRISLPSFRRSKRLSQKKDTSSSLVERDELVKIKEEDAVKEEEKKAVTMDVLENKASEMSVSSNEEADAQEKETTLTPKAAAEETVECVLGESEDAKAKDDAPIPSTENEPTPEAEAEDEIPDVEAAHTNQEPCIEAVQQNDKVAIGFYQEPTDDEVQEEKDDDAAVEESQSPGVMANVSSHQSSLFSNLISYQMVSNGILLT